MGKFEFRSSALELDIDGNKFEVRVSDPHLQERLQSFGKEAINVANEAADKISVSERFTKAIDLCDRGIDEVLGEGASEKIFAGRTRDLLDRIDVVVHITREIDAFRAERLRQFSPERAMRAGKK